MKYSVWDFRFSRQRVWSLVFWDIAPCSHIEVHRRLRGANCLHHQGDNALMMEAVRTSETSVNFVTTRRYIPEYFVLKRGHYRKCIAQAAPVKSASRSVVGHPCYLRQCLSQHSPKMSLFLIKQPNKIRNVNNYNDELKSAKPVIDLHVTPVSCCVPKITPKLEQFHK
jgi:hypothetical protein